jgi:hypothetical protein
MPSHAIPTLIRIDLGPSKRHKAVKISVHLPQDRVNKVALERRVGACNRF